MSGKAIALRAARDGANIAIVAKTEQPHPKLPGTIYSAPPKRSKPRAGEPCRCRWTSETTPKSRRRRSAARSTSAASTSWSTTRGHTAALAMIPGFDPNHCRTPEILADAAYIILNRDSRKHTGDRYIDEEVLAAEGVVDLARYAVVPGTKNLLPDLFVD